MRKTIFATLAVALMSAGIQGFAESSLTYLAAAIPASGAIMGTGKLTEAQLAGVLTAENKTLERGFAEEFSKLYIREAAAEGVNHDVAFFQMCKETNFLKFDGLVTKESNNFGGIGAVNGKNRGVRFPSAAKGVRAQIQHLKGYASNEPLAQACEDPRYYSIYRGSAKSIYSITGLWSSDLAYGENLQNAAQEAGQEIIKTKIDDRTQLALQ